MLQCKCMSCIYVKLSLIFKELHFTFMYVLSVNTFWNYSSYLFANLLTMIKTDFFAYRRYCRVRRLGWGLPPSKLPGPVAPSIKGTGSELNMCEGPDSERADVSPGWPTWKVVWTWMWESVTQIAGRVYCWTYIIHDYIPIILP